MAAQKRHEAARIPDSFLSGTPNLPGFPSGDVELCGVPYEIGDGAVPVEPGLETRGIPVGKKGTEVRFLHTGRPGPAVEQWRDEVGESIETGCCRPDSLALFTYVVRYQDGTELKVPVRWGEAIEAASRRTFEPVSGFLWDMPCAEVAWTGELDYEEDARPAVYAMRWPNPYPERTIVSVDVLGPETDGGARGTASVLAITVPDVPAAGDTYYISPAGDDANPGTFERPWATLHKAAAALEAGDTVYVREGTYRVNEIISPHNSGREGAWITYAGFPGETATIVGFDIPVPEPGYEMVVDNGEKTEVMAGRSGVFHILDRSFIRVRNLHFHRAAYQAISVDALEWWVSDPPECDGSHHIELLHNTIYRTVGTGLGVWGVPGAECRDIRILGNKVLNAFDPGLALESTNPGWQADRRERVRRESGGNDEDLDLHNVWGFEVAYNEVSWGGKEGIDLKARVRDGSVHHNHCHDMFVIRGFLGGKAGIYLDSWIDDQRDIEVHHNVIERCGTGIRVMNEGGSPHYNLSIHHNLLVDNYWIGIAVRGGSGDGYSHHIRVLNNTCWRNGFQEDNEGPGGAISVSTPTIQLRDVLVRNNICAAGRDYALAHHRDALLEAHDIVMDYNLAHPEARADRFERLVPTTGQEPIEAEPGFIDPEHYNFHLRADSPAVDAGHPAEEYRDPDGTRADLGAFPRPQDGAGEQEKR